MKKSSSGIHVIEGRIYQNPTKVVWPPPHSFFGARIFCPGPSLRRITEYLGVFIGLTAYVNARSPE